MPATTPIVRRIGLLIAAAPFAGGCSDGATPPPVPSVLEVSGTYPGAAPVGSVLAPEVRVLDSRLRPIHGVLIAFQADGGAVASESAETNANGIAAPGAWTLSTHHGQNFLVARHGQLSVVFTVQATAGPPVSLEPLSAVQQSAEAGQAVAEPPAVRVVDQYGNPVGGVAVTFEVTAGGGSLLGATQISDVVGAAIAGPWTLGDTGINTVTAALPGSVGLTFEAVATEPTGTVLAKLAGDSTTCPVSVAGCVFGVRFTDAGKPVAGETITWSDGAGASAVTVTDSRGIASAVNLGSNTVPGTRTQTATAGSTGQTVTFDYALVTGGGYDMHIRYIGATPSLAVQAAFIDARVRWERIITGELADIQVNASAGDCGAGFPGLTEVVDDLLVLVLVDSIDGRGNILGSAGPCMIRGSNRLPMVGAVRLDSADLADLSGNGLLEDVITHELGHALGIPALWVIHDLVHDTATADPYYSGARAASSFRLAGGTLVSGLGVPVENTGGSGTRGRHWREAVLSNELMTGYINFSSNPLSAITVGALMDIGYEVNFGAADAYMIPGAGTVAGHAVPRELRELPMPPPRVVH